MLRLSGVALDRIAKKFGVHRDAIWRHCDHHMSAEQRAAYLVGLARLQELAEAAAAEGLSVIDFYKVVRSTLFAQLDRLASANDHAGVATTARALRAVLKDMAKITGELTDLTRSTIVNVQNNSVILSSPPFADLQAGLLQVCAAHPEARADIVALFNALDQKYTKQAAKLIEAKEVVHA